MKIFVLDKNFTPQDPVHPAVARILLSERKAFVHKRFPLVLRLGEVSSKSPHGLQLKLDPGSVTTGLALVNHQTGEVVWGAELIHRSRHIKMKLEKRRALRRSRRNRKTRYRPARFDHRTRPKGWLPPSLMSRVYNMDTWVQRLRSYTYVTGISVENCKFDTQRMQNPDISGILYQQGDLAGFEVKEYLLEKFNRTCVYCGAQNVPLQVEHVVPKARGGSDRISNLALACVKCNQKKGAKPIEEFLKKKPELLKSIKAGLKAPLKDAAAINATRWEIWRRLTATGLPVECGSGALTKFNRKQQGLPKAHWLDAACAGKSTPVLTNTELTPLLIKASGHGSRQRCRTNKFGFPTRYCKRSKCRGMFQTGDMVSVSLSSGKSQGPYIGRLITRVKPSFKVGTVDGVHPRRLILLQKCDGYSYIV